MPNKFLTTQCSIRKAGLNSKFAIACVVHYRVTRPYGLNICSVGELLLIYFTLMLEFQAPPTGLGLVDLFPLPEAGSECREKKLIPIWGG